MALAAGRPASLTRALALWWRASLWLSLVGPSLFVVHKYTARPGVAAYLVGSVLCVWLIPRLPLPRTARATTAWALLTFAAVVIVFALVYPRVDVHTPGQGSDDDDALNLGASALVTGHSPYTERTYLGNVLHQLPGAFLLATPFVWAGTSALQNLFWMPLFFLAARREMADRREDAGGESLRMAWLVLACCPVVLHEIVTGTGRGSNTIYVLLGLWWLTRTRRPIAAAAAWGVALASRANFLFLLPLAFGWLRQRYGTRAALGAMSVTSATVLCLAVPFYLNDPSHFGPLEAANRLTVFEAVLPHAAAAITLGMAALSIGLSFVPMDTAALFRNSAIVQAVPVVAGVALGARATGNFALAYATYGTFVLWFVLMALAALPGWASPRPTGPALGQYSEGS
ncbi:MAG TPA: hypothetical protein VIX35_04910 [Vicinamibacterales bacterium]